jgi:hypothetical protein
MTKPCFHSSLFPLFVRVPRWFAVGVLLLINTGYVHSAKAAESNVDLAQLPPPKRVVVPKLKGELKLDGKLEESVWPKAAVLKPFLPNNGGGQEREGTEVRLWYDDQALHLAWICTDRDIQATFTKRDSRFWEEEVVEFFVTAGGLERYFELQWNPLGGVFDAIIDNELGADGVSKKFTGNWDYTAQGMKSGVFVKGTVANSSDQDSFWQVEVSVPFADLSRTTPKPGEVWRANFYRFNRGKDHPAELLSWSPTQLPGFHQPSRFGYLEFGK